MKQGCMRMKTVVLLSLIGTVTLVLLCSVILFLQTYQQSLIRNAQTSARRSIAQASSTVDEYLAGTDEIMEYLESMLENGTDGRADFFSVFLETRPDIAAVTTYNERGELLYCYSLGRQVLPQLEKNLSFSAALMPKYGDGYVSAPHVVTLFEGYYPWVVTIISSLDGGTDERWVAMDIGCSSISSYINDVGIGQRGYCFIMDADGNIVYHPQQQLINYGLKTENTDLISSLSDGSCVDGSVIYTVQSLENGRWRVVGVSFVQEIIAESVREVTKIVLLAAVVILAAAFIISAVLSAALSRPLNSLAAAMTQFEQDTDNFCYSGAGGVREVRALSDSFGHMVVKIQNLVDAVRSEEQKLRKTELRALQAQINPHFLYNTLDSISWMCEQGKNAEAVQMVNALARLFRISISRGHELIPVRSELQHAESYLQIQSYRYKNQFTYSFEAEEECMDFLCNKITLQPIIENSLYHGINGLVDEGRICVTAKSEGDDVVFTVSDNGAGMDEEQIRAIMSKERSDKAGIGIKNVNDRLKIYFGSRYGISIDSAPDEGTRVLIRMPKITGEADSV